MRRLLLFLLVLIPGVAWADYTQENQLWTREILDYARTQEPPVRQALEQIVKDAESMGTLNRGRQHDALLATMDKIRRAQAEPQGAVARERLDSPVSNFGEVDPGRLYRGAQPSSAGLRWLKSQGVHTVIVLREPGVEETNYPDWSRQAYLEEIRALGMRPVEIPIRDRSVPTPEQINQFLLSVRAGTPAPGSEGIAGSSFVHCSAGIGRTGIMCGLYQRQHGASPEQALEQADRFGLHSRKNSDAAVQSSFLATYPVVPSALVEIPGPLAPGGPNPVTQALAEGKAVYLRLVSQPDTPAPSGPSPLVAAEILCRLVSDPQRSYLVTNPGPDLMDRHPLFPLIKAMDLGYFLCLRLTPGEAGEVLASMARVVPESRRLLWADSQPPAELDRLRRLLGPAPCVVRCSLPETPAALDALARSYQGHAELLDFGQNPPAETLRHLFRDYRLACVLRLTPQDSMPGLDGIPYLVLLSP